MAQWWRPPTQGHQTPKCFSFVRLEGYQSCLGLCFLCSCAQGTPWWLILCWGDLDLVSQALPLGTCWCLGSPMAATLNLLSLVFWFQLVIMKWVPPHRSLWPTNQRRTLLGWVLSSSLRNCFTCICFYWWLSIYVPVLFWDFCKEKSLPLWLKTTIRRILWLVSGK